MTSRYTSCVMTAHSTATMVSLINRKSNESTNQQLAHSMKLSIECKCAPKMFLFFFFLVRVVFEGEIGQTRIGGTSSLREKNAERNWSGSLNG